MKYFLFTIVAVLLFCRQAKAQGADLVLEGGNVITLREKGDRASAIAIKGNRILQVGTNRCVSHLIGKNTKVIHLNGKTVVPGFNDVHQHPAPIYPDSALYAVLSLEKMTSMAELLGALRKKAAHTPKGMLVLGRGYDELLLGGQPVRDSLDKASLDHPIIIRHVSGHLSAANSFALQLNKLDSATPDPPGGAFGREPGGRLNGICKESASSMLYKSSKLIYPPKPGAAEELTGYQLYFKSLLESGITSVGDAWVNPEKVTIYQKLVAGHFPMRFNLLIGSDYLDDVISGRIKRVSNDNIRIQGIKVFHGNSLSGKTCWLYQPYDSINAATGQKDYYGIPPARSQAGLDSLFLKIHLAGLQIACHSNGDREIDMVLAAMEKAQTQHPRKARHRIEHCSIVSGHILERIRDDEVIPVFHCYMYELGDKLLVYGKDRLAMIHPTRWALNMGIHFALHSDAPVSPFPVMKRLESAITRKTRTGLLIGANQTIDAEDAIKAYTLEGAYTTFEENKKGSIMPRQLADLVILDQDPTEIDQSKIHDVKVLATVMGGKVVYRNALFK